MENYLKVKYQNMENLIKMKNYLEKIQAGCVYVTISVKKTAASTYFQRTSENDELPLDDQRQKKCFCFKVFNKYAYIFTEVCKYICD